MLSTITFTWLPGDSIHSYNPRSDHKCTIANPLVYFNHIAAAVRHVMSYHYNVYLLCYSRHVRHSSHASQFWQLSGRFWFVRLILVCQDIVVGQQRILIISSVIPPHPFNSHCHVCHSVMNDYYNVIIRYVPFFCTSLKPLTPVCCSGISRVWST